MSPPSKRFSSSKWSDFAVPAILIMLTIGLLLVLVAVALSMIGMPVF